MASIVLQIQHYEQLEKCQSICQYYSVITLNGQSVKLKNVNNNYTNNVFFDQKYLIQIKTATQTCLQVYKQINNNKPEMVGQATIMCPHTIQDQQMSLDMFNKKDKPSGKLIIRLTSMQLLGQDQQSLQQYIDYNPQQNNQMNQTQQQMQPQQQQNPQMQMQSQCNPQLQQQQQQQQIPQNQLNPQNQQQNFPQIQQQQQFGNPQMQQQNMMQQSNYKQDVRIPDQYKKYFQQQENFYQSTFQSQALQQQQVQQQQFQQPQQQQNLQQVPIPFPQQQIQQQPQMQINQNNVLPQQSQMYQQQQVAPSQQYH